MYVILYHHISFGFIYCILHRSILTEWDTVVPITGAQEVQPSTTQHQPQTHQEEFIHYSWSHHYDEITIDVRFPRSQLSMYSLTGYHIHQSTTSDGHSRRCISLDRDLIVQCRWTTHGSTVRSAQSHLQHHYIYGMGSCPSTFLYRKPSSTPKRLLLRSQDTSRWSLYPMH